MKILMCEDSIDGIFTAIYDVWACRYHHNEIKVQVIQEHNLELFTEYITIDTDLEKAVKVTRTLYHRFGEDAYSSICQAALSNDPKKADAIYHVILLGLKLTNGSDIMNCLNNPYVYTTFELSRQTANEAHHYLGFIRFMELDNGILLAQISPQNNILTLVAPHFSDRLPGENWMIYDETRNLALVHESHSSPILVYNESLDIETASRFSSEELEFQELWKAFFETIAIKERINPKLQQQNFPKRFWNNITELRHT